MFSFWLSRVAALCCAVVLLSSCTTQQDGNARSEPVELKPSEPFTQVITVEFQSADTEPVPLVAWLADTPERRALGLMHRSELVDGTGMLFAFPQDHAGGFWMKNTLIPLSIAYVAADGEIVAILDMQPCQADPCPTYDPGQAYRYAVEANLGWFAANGITAGWRLDLPTLADSPA